MKSKTMRYILVGGINTFFGFFLFTAMYLALDEISKFVIVIVSTVISVVFSHFTQRNFVWRSQKFYLTELLKYGFWNLLTLLANIFFLFVFTDLLGFNTLITQYVIASLLIIAMYFIQKFSIFKE